VALSPTLNCGNALLDTMTPAAFRALSPSITYVDMPLRKVLVKSSQNITHVFFPCSGMFSMVRELEDGSTTEVGLIGSEGFVGVPLLLGAGASHLEALVQGTGRSIKISAPIFKKLVNDNPPFRKRLLLYAQCLHVQVTQTAVCNARHNLSQRLARWMLETHDRVGQPVLSLSHEFLSYMLGVRRAGVTDALKQFTLKKLIITGRGRVTIRDRKGVERAACECYRAVKTETKRLMAA